jgi:hypothetical protein
MGQIEPGISSHSHNSDHHQRHSPYAPTHQPAAQGSFGNGGFGAQSREEGDRRMREATARREEQARREAERARHAQRVQNYQDNSAASILRTTCDSDDDYDGDFGGAMVRLPAPTPPRPHPPLPQVESQACPQRGLASANDQPSASTLSDLSILGGGNPQAPAKQGKSRWLSRGLISFSNSPNPEFSSQSSPAPSITVPVYNQTRQKAQEAPQGPRWRRPRQGPRFRRPPPQEA